MMIGMNLSMASNPSQVTVIQQAIAVLRKFGSDAHVYLPGVGMLNGLTAGNYIDSAGTQLGAVDQPVGLALDAAGALGVELVVNGTNLVSTSGWTQSDANSVFSANAGKLRLTSPNASAALGYQILTTVVGKTYFVSVVAYAGTGTSRVLIGTTAGSGNIFSEIASSTPARTVNLYFVATTTASYLQFTQSTATAGLYTEFETISVREVTGIHAQQPTTASKPILRRGAVNLLTYSGDFSNAAWLKSASTIGANGAIIASVIDSSDKVVAQSSISALASANYTACIRVKKGAVGWCYISQFNQVSSGVRRYFNLNSGAVGSSDNFNGGTDAAPPSIVDSGDGYWLIALAQTGASNTTSITLRIGPANADLGRTYGAADVVSAQIFVAGAALFQGTLTAAQIQALGGIPVTTTAPASTALGPYFWQFDGSNDSLSLGGPLFQMADDHCVVAGFKPVVAASMAVFAPVYTGATVRYAYAMVTSGGSMLIEWYDGTQYVPLSTSYVAGSDYVVSAKKVGASLTARKNGVQFGSGAAFSTAVSGATSAIGGSGSHPTMNGNIYPVIAIKGTVPDADLLLLEKLVGQMSGVSI